MNVRKFIKPDAMDQYVDGELNEIADCFYNFMQGFWNLEEVGYPELNLKDVVTNEYSQNSGNIRKYFYKIYEIEDKLQTIEYNTRKNENNFDPESSMVEELKSLYHNLMHDSSRKMFLYCVKFGTKLAKKI